MKDDPVVDRSEIQIELVKLINGERLCRLTEPHSGLSLEKKLDAHQPVVLQKERLLGVFEAALAREDLHVA